MGSAVAQIPVGSNHFALIDAGDFDRVSRHRWALKRGKAGVLYARTDQRGTNKLGQVCYLHQMVIPTGRGYMVDHRNSDGLDNRKENLRRCTVGENNCHRRSLRGLSGKGFYFDKKLNCYRTQIRIQGRRIHVGLFKDSISAAQAYDDAAKKFHGEFVQLNFPEESAS